MSVGFDTFGSSDTTVFVVKNITTKVLNIFGVKLAPGQTYNLMKLTFVSEADLRNSLLKGSLKTKIANGSIEVTESNIDLLQFDNAQKEFLQDAGVTIGTSAGGSAGNDIVLIDGSLTTFDSSIEFNDSTFVTSNTAVNINGQLAVDGSGVTVTNLDVNGTLSADAITANSANIATTISAATANISGTATAATGNITGTLTANAANVTTLLTAGSANVTGAVAANAVNVTTTVLAATLSSTNLGVSGGAVGISNSDTTFANGNIIQSGTNRFIDTSANSGNIRLKVAPEANAAVTTLATGTDVDLDITLTENGFYTFTVVCFVKLATALTYRKLSAIVSARRVAGTLTPEAAQVDLNLGSLTTGITLTLSANSGNLRVNVDNTTGETVDGRVHVGWELEDLI